MILAILIYMAVARFFGAFVYLLCAVLGTDIVIGRKGQVFGILFDSAWLILLIVAILIWL